MRLKTFLILLFVFLFGILAFQCESSQNRLEYFLSERIKETEAVQKICESISIASESSGGTDYIEDMNRLKDQFKKSRTELLKRSFGKLQIEPNQQGIVKLDNIGNLLFLSNQDKKKLPVRDKDEWIEKYNSFLKNKKVIQDKIKLNKDISKEMEELKKSLDELLNKDNMIYSLKISFTQALVVAIIHNANQAEKNLDKQIDRLGTVGIVVDSVAREILTEVFAQLVEIVIPFIEKKDLINPIDFTNESCKVYRKYETTPGVANRLLKRSILRFLKEDNSEYSLTRIYNLNHLVGVQDESEMGKKEGLAKLQKKKEEYLKKISPKQTLFTYDLPECTTEECQSLNFNIKNHSLLPSIPPSNLTDALLLSYDKCTQSKEKCENDSKGNKEVLLVDSIQKCIGSADCNWEIVNQEISWNIWHSSPVISNFNDFITLKKRNYDNLSLDAENNDKLLLKMEELESNIRSLRNDIFQSLNSGCAGQLEQQRLDRIQWLKALQKIGYTVELKSKSQDFTSVSICNLNENITISKGKINALVPTSSICSFQPIEMSLEIKGLFGHCEYKIPDDETLAVETMQLLENLRDTLHVNVFTLHVIGFTDNVNTTNIDCKDKIKKGINPKEPMNEFLKRDCPKPCDGNIALSYLRALHFKNYLAKSEKAFHGQMSYIPYGLSLYDPVESNDPKLTQEFNRRVKLRVFTVNSRYGCY